MKTQTVLPLIFHSYWSCSHVFISYKLKVSGFSPSKALTQWVSLAIFVWDGEDSNDGVAFLPKLFVNLLSEQTLTNHCNLHPHTFTVLEGQQHAHTSMNKSYMELVQEFKTHETCQKPDLGSVGLRGLTMNFTQSTC